MFALVPLCLAVAILSLQLEDVQGITDPNLPSNLFYPFGHDEGDSVAPVNDDGSSGRVPISTGFPFFNKTYMQLFVNTNGAISFGVEVSTFTPSSFPVAQPMVAAYWCDVDTRKNPGRVYYRESIDSTLLNRATRDVVSIYSARGLYFFQAKWILIATWYNVTYYGGNYKTPVNNFQAVLVTDGRYSFAIFNYGPMTWTTGTASGGNASNGLGGTPAQVGFNAGDSVNYFAVPDSRTPDIVRIGDVTNTGQQGRWMFRIDAAAIEVGGCFKEGLCQPYQRQNGNGTSQVCYDIAPDFRCPSLEGPTVINRLWFEFYCVVPTNTTDPTARFNVTFLFDGVPSRSVPQFTITAAQGKATLHEKYLYGQMGKWISCSVSSFWDNGRSSPAYSNVVSSFNSYWAGIQASPDVLTVYEGSSEPGRVILRSTLPITCMTINPSTGQPMMCSLSIQLITSADISLRSSEGDCGYTLTESDWKQDESRAYNISRPIEVFARKDPFTTRPRLNTLGAKIEDFSQLKKVGQSPSDTYNNPWQGYSIPNILVYRNDAPVAVCRAYGDPNVATFDHLSYPIYATGQFTYVQTTRGLPVQVQVRHWPCGQVVSCVCAVAIREGDLILAADMCADGVMRYISNNQALPIGTWIDVFAGGYGFQMSTSSGIKVVGYLRSWGMNIEIYVTSSEVRRVEGLCGSFDFNILNDLKVKDTNETFSTLSNSTSLSRVVASWSVPLGFSLFNGYLSNLPAGPGNSGDPNNICSCGESDLNCGANVINSALDPSLAYLVGQTGPLGVNQRVRRSSTSQEGQPGTFNINPRVPRSWNSSQNYPTDQDSSNDNVDYEYDAQPFNYSFGKNDSLPTFSWPAPNNMTEAQATEYCRKLLWDNSNIRQLCSGVVSPSDVSGVISQCVLDIKVSGDVSWANDKIPEIQNLCLSNIVTANNTESNRTIAQILAQTRQVLATTCLPQDCSGHGTCVNGSCVCNTGYVGYGCQMARDAVPSTIRINGPPSCDVRRGSCLYVRLFTANVTSLSTTACKVDITKADSTKQSYLTSATVESPSVTVCTLPQEALRNFINHLNLTSASSFDNLPKGSPSLFCDVSVSNNGQLFSNAQTYNVFDSVCYNCQSASCTQKTGSCLINGYCFSEGGKNPWNPNCQECDSAADNSKWKTLPGNDKCSGHGNGATALARLNVIGSLVLIIAVALIL